MSTEAASSLLYGETKSSNIPVEHLDYDFIQKSNDVKYLEKIVRVLRSGEEGLYPHLTEFCEKRIEKLNPMSRALRKENLPATAACFSADEWKQITEDLKMWETDVRMNEVELKKMPIFVDMKVPPVRGSNVSVALKQEMPGKGENKCEKNPLPRAYREWDKFDVEKECAKVDEGFKEQNSPVQYHPLPKISQKIDTEVLTATERAILANREKEKGNEAYRANDFEEAAAYYARSLSVMPTAAVYNNRAQAEIKLQLWHSALSDCEKALELEPGNLKALLRRATVQKQLGNLKMAADDLRNVLQAEPQNEIAKKLLEDVEKKDAAASSADQKKGTKILIQEVEDDEDDDDGDEAAPAEPGQRVGGESVAAPAETGDMGNAHKKPPGRGDGAPNAGHTHHQGHWRGKRGSLDKHKGQPEPAKKDLANGAQGAGSGGAERSGGGAADRSAGSGGEDDGRLDAPCGALPPPLARLKNEGNQLFKNGQFADALGKYSQAITGFTDSGIDSPEDLSILYSNRAACHLKDGNSTDCIQDCTRALELQPFSLKPLLRRAMAHESLERYRKAYVDYKTVLQIDMGVQSAHDSVNRITKLLIEQDGPDWREKLPEMPLVPLSAQRHRREEPPNAELVRARAARAAQETARRAEARFASTKQEGNDCVKNGRFQEAVEKYSECLKLKPDECAIYTNRALCYLKQELFAEAKQDCDSALQLEPSNKKAFYRRALAYKGLKDYLACSSDLQEVLQLDPNVHEAEKELEEVTVLLRQSLAAAASPGKPRKSVPITEVDGSEEETDPADGTVRNDCDGEDLRIPTRPTNAYEFGQALNAARSRGDTAACAELLKVVAPETLPQYVSNKLDGQTIQFLVQALDGHLLQKDPNLVYQHLSHLHTAERFPVVLLLLGKSERRQMTQLFENLAAAETGEFTANDVQNLANRYI